MKNVIKFAKDNGMDFETKTSFLGLRKIIIRHNGQVIVIRERNSDRVYTVKGWEGHSEKYSVSINGVRYEHFTNTQRECVEYIIEHLESEKAAAEEEIEAAAEAADKIEVVVDENADAETALLKLFTSEGNPTATDNAYQVGFKNQLIKSGGFYAFNIEEFKAMTIGHLAAEKEKFERLGSARLEGRVDALKLILATINAYQAAGAAKESARAAQDEIDAQKATEAKEASEVAKEAKKENEAAAPAKNANKGKFLTIRRFARTYGHDLEEIEGGVALTVEGYKFEFVSSDKHPNAYQFFCKEFKEKDGRMRWILESNQLQSLLDVSSWLATYAGIEDTPAQEQIIDFYVKNRRH